MIIGAIGTCLGACVGHFLTVRQVEKETKRKKRYIANVICNDIKEIEGVIKPIIKYYEKHYITVGSVGTLNQVILETKVDWNKFNSLYDENCLYFHFRKEIYLLDEDIVKSISKFYNSILQAEKEYKIYMNCLNSTEDKEYKNAWKIQDSILKHLQHANEEASDLLNLLNPN